MSKMHLLSIAVVSMLAGCGGGGEPVAAVPTPQAVTGALRARALAVALATPVSPAEAARPLMDFGERTFSQYFPGKHSVNPYRG